MKRLFCDHLKRNVTELSGAWRFMADPKNEIEEKGLFASLPRGESVIVPSVWNNELGLLNYEGKGYYEKKFFTEGGTLLFEFESVMTKADVWLDGNKIGSHYGGFSQFEITVENVSCGEHTLIVCADNTFDCQSIPQRKVDWFNYGGIARDVYVSRLFGICILNNRIIYTLSQDYKSAVLCAELELYNASDREETTYLTLTLGDKELYREKIKLEPHQRLELTTTPCEISDIKLWSMEEPTLYTVSAKTDTDDFIDRVGFRKIEVKDKKICLNGKAIQLRGVNRHEEHPDWGFAFPPKLMKKDIDLICHLGCNTVRGAHYPQSRIFVDMLDERGILFWSEIPIWGGGFPDTVLTDEVVVQRGLEMHREMTRYYYNHPSIIIWGMHNEIYTLYPCTYGISKQYSRLLREKGGNRLITHAAAFPLDDDSAEFDDIICINMYKGWYGGDFCEWDKFLDEYDCHRKKKGLEDKPVIMSEFGAGALAGFHSHFDSVRWSEEYQAELLEYCLELFNKTDYIQGYYIWQFANIRTSPDMDLNRVRTYNNKGILDEYRNPKSAFFTVKRLNEKFEKEEKREDNHENV